MANVIVSQDHFTVPDAEIPHIEGLLAVPRARAEGIRLNTGAKRSFLENQRSY
ncbi:hypothetical protein GTU99_02205 [Streptomyces sp. PRKS01-65]|nr:hypothetical protein [Streptomyces harenosi]NEY31028.1 hypothetical protein [Streptomyces harenosi]